MASFIRKVMSPAIYHGVGKPPPFFEGWYYKLVSSDANHRYAIIPGVILGQDAHAFIQVLDGASGKSTYHTFPMQDFRALPDDFEVRIANNIFTRNSLELDLKGESGSLSGALEFEGVVPWPVTILSPGIMGWYAWIPHMECYHGVLSFNHRIRGSLNANGDILDFSAGYGYIEKDWGQSFPDAWVWFQSNHFPSTDACLTASVAIIPWLNGAFPGFIVGLYYQRRLYRFATYTGAKIRKLEVDEDSVHWIIADKKYILELIAHRAPGGLLLGPTQATMGKRVDETINASVKVTLRSLDGRAIFDEEGKFAGLEVNGDLPRLLGEVKKSNPGY
jgi:hypothetical protein